jgi:hypothetical protein
VTDPRGLPKVFCNHLRAGLGGNGRSRAQSVNLSTSGFADVRAAPRDFRVLNSPAPPTPHSAADMTRAVSGRRDQLACAGPAPERHVTRSR